MLRTVWKSWRAKVAPLLDDPEQAVFMPNATGPGNQHTIALRALRLTAGLPWWTLREKSSLAFTPVQGIELVNPSQKQDSKEGTETYFSKQAAFFAGGS